MRVLGLTGGTERAEHRLCPRDREERGEWCRELKPFQSNFAATKG